MTALRYYDKSNGAMFASPSLEAVLCKSTLPGRLVIQLRRSMTVLSMGPTCGSSPSHFSEHLPPCLRLSAPLSSQKVLEGLGECPLHTHTHTHTQGKFVSCPSLPDQRRSTQTDLSAHFASASPWIINLQAQILNSHSSFHLNFHSPNIIPI